MEIPPRDVRRTLEDHPQIKEGGLHQPMPQVIYHIPATGWHKKLKVIKRPIPDRRERPKLKRKTMKDMDFIAVKPISKEKYCAKITKNL